ncbi:hypothetical protein Tco_1027876, partial [Tanacetum coccineum]
TRVKISDLKKMTSLHIDSIKRSIDLKIWMLHTFACQTDINLGEYHGVDDNWLGVVSSQGLSLLSADLSGSYVTDIGLCRV